MDTLLVGVIREAFPDGIPPKRPITSHLCIECDEVEKLMGGRLWWDVANNFPEQLVILTS